MPWIMHADLTIGDAREMVDAQVIVIVSWLMRQIKSQKTRKNHEKRELQLELFEMEL
jgi:hypothetical protein